MFQLWKGTEMKETESILKEIAEARSAAEKALLHLRSAEEKLKKASGWGIADILGGGLIVTALKRSRMHEAQHELELASEAVKIFNRELSDVEGMENIQIETSGFLSVADYLFDNVIVDLLAQNEISDVLSRVKDAEAGLEDLIDRLNDREEEAVEEARLTGDL